MQKHISQHVENEVATRYFLEAARFPEGLVLAETFVGRIAPHLHQILETHRQELLGIPPEILVVLATHPEIVVRREGDLYRYIVEYLELHGNGMDQEMALQIVSGIQFTHLTSTELTEASTHPMIPEKLVMTGMLERLQKFEASGGGDLGAKLKRHCVQQHRKFTYVEDLDCNGILYHLGSNGGSDPYTNPALLGRVKVSSGKMCYGDIHNVVGRAGVDLWTDDDPNETWYVIDFTPDKSVRLDAYTLRRGGGASRSRDWVLEGTNPEQDWTLVFEHIDDRLLESSDDDYGTHTWKIEPDSPGAGLQFERLRLRMTKPAHDGDWYFAVSGVEIYGDLITSC
eukprot:TRINITY_DN20090_c0_g1_i20.p1 TRINITY_DN20090_c0_g1~~TRINITY_DN20090_c0_g1_i20.p1  ORF type:complete len:341 (+),score=64.80 TRINITY_DN20090_c0_g1_i20:295-1317(+)